MLRMFPRLSILLCLAVGLLGAQDKLVQDALGIIEKYEVLEPDLKAGDTRVANGYINALNAAAKRLNAAYDKNTVHWKDATTRYRALVDRIKVKAQGAVPTTPPSGREKAARSEGSSGELDARALLSLENSIKKTFHSWKSTRVEDLDDAARVQRYRETLTGYRLQLDKFPAEDSRVKDVATSLESLAELLGTGLKTLEARRAPAGSAEKLQALVDFYKAHDLLRPLEAPYDVTRVKTWASEVRRVRDERLPADLAWLDSVRDRVGIDRDAWQRVRGWIVSSWPLRIRSLLESSGGSIYAAERTGNDLASSVLGIDPKDEHHIANRVLAEGVLAATMERLQGALEDLDVAEAYDSGIGRTDVPDRQSAKKTVARAIAHLQVCATEALASIRLPKSQSDDPKLLASAAQVLKDTKLETSGIERMVINYDVHRKEKREGTIQRGTTSSSVTLDHYVWDEFQVTSAEQIGDTYWLFYSRLRYYHQGASTTPTGRWILAERFKGTPILKENIAK